MATISTSDVVKARAQLASMRTSLQAWLKYRTLNDQIAGGAVPSRMPVELAQQVMVKQRDWDLEQRLADQLTVLLHEIDPNAQLPNPTVKVNPGAAVALAQMAIAAIGGAPISSVSSPTATSGWIMPAIIAGGLLLAFTTAVKTVADVAKEKERLKCVEAGACTDYGFWLKAGGIAMLAWLAWTQMGLGETVKSYMPRKRA
jgi:hypothetical protein